MTYIGIAFVEIWLFGAFVTRFDMNDRDCWPHPANVICFIAALVHAWLVFAHT